MQMPTQDPRQPILPNTQLQPQSMQQQPTYQERPEKRPRRGRFLRFMRGYLMLVGSLTTLYVIIQLLVLLFVEIGKWMPTQPIL